MLKEKGIDYRYREYTEEPLSEMELRETLSLLGMKPGEVLRRNDPAFREQSPERHRARRFPDPENGRASYPAAKTNWGPR